MYEILVFKSTVTKYFEGVKILGYVINSVVSYDKSTVYSKASSTQRAI